MNLATLNKINYGLYIASSRKGEKLNGQIINTAVQVTAEPCQLAVVINKKNLTHEFIMVNRAFSISILSQQTPLQFIGLFGFKSGREIDKFKDVKYKIGKTGVPILLENCVGYFECELVEETEVGTHTIFVGRVVDADIISDEQPMTYAFYREVKHGKTQANAPTYRKSDDKGEKEAGKMAKYRCTVCGYIYDPAQGDPDSGVKAGTPFERLPADWVCPVCGAAKDKFVKEG